MFHVYTLRSATTRRYYVGHTQHLGNRLAEHNSGEGKSTRAGVPWDVVWTNEVVTRRGAMALEKQIKSRGITRYLSDAEIALPG